MMCQTCNGHGLRFSGITGKVELCPTCEGKLDCDGIPPACGHNHHTGRNRAWGKGDWVLTSELDTVEGYDLEEHIKNLLERADNAEQ